MINMNNNEIDFFDLLQIYSIFLGIYNIQENRFQTAQNDVQSANDKQAKFLLEKLKEQFDTQNEILNDISKRLKKIEESRS